jgi:ribosome-binding factor A
MHYKRSVRVAEQLKREIGRIIIEDIKDPLIDFVTITQVELTDDLKYAKIYFTVLGEDAQRQKVIERLDGATKFIRSKIGRLIDLRYVPEIRFLYDSVFDNVTNLERLLKQIKEEDS